MGGYEMGSLNAVELEDLHPEQWILNVLAKTRSIRATLFQSAMKKKQRFINPSASFPHQLFGNNLTTPYQTLPSEPHPKEEVTDLD